MPGTVTREDCAGVITGSISAKDRQAIIDSFAGTRKNESAGAAPGGDKQAESAGYEVIHVSDGEEDAGKNVLICQIQAGGTGLNIQAASIVIFCEPQIKPSLTNQAISRVYRMGQVRNVLVYHLLCENTVDEAVMEILEEKQLEFDLYADESAMAEATEGLFDREWIRQYMEEERKRYMPMVVSS